MKRVIIDIADEYAGAVSVTAIGVGQVGMRSEAHIKTTVVLIQCGTKEETTKTGRAS